MDLGQKIILSFWFVFFFCALIAVQIATRSAATKQSDLLLESNYAIGTVQWSSAVFASDKHNIYFSFDLPNAKNFVAKKEYTRDIVSEEQYQQVPQLTESSFLVLYDPQHPLRASIMLDRPVRDSVEFRSHVAEIEKLRNKSLF